MSSGGLKKIRVPKELLEASWGTFFQDQGIELEEFTAEEISPDVPYQIVDSFIPENLLLENPQVNNLLKSYFKDGKDFDLVDQYSVQSKELYSIKIHDFLNLGHFIDAIVVEAYKYNFSCNAIRAYLNAGLTYAFKVLHDEKELAPIEIFFGSTEEGFVVQISMPAKKLQFDKNLRRLTSFLDVTEYKKKSQYTVSALWFKDEALKDFHLYLNKIQFVPKNSKDNHTNISAVSDAENIPYNPALDQGDNRLKFSSEKTEEQITRIKGSKSAGDEVFRIKGSGADESSGNLKVSGSSQAQMEQQMLRMKDLLYKMKEQMHQQKVAFESAQATGVVGAGSPELQSKIEELQLENTKLQDEKKYINARLQLANRKLQILDSSLDRSAEMARSNPAPEKVNDNEKELELLKQQNSLLAVKLREQDERLKAQDEKMRALAAAKPQAEKSSTADGALKDLEIIKLNEIKVLYENKMKEQLAENKKLDGRVKVLATQLDGALKKLTGPASGMKTNENHAKQLEHASNRVAEVTKEYNDKKKEVIQVKQENEKLLGKIAELEKKVLKITQKAA